MMEFFQNLRWRPGIGDPSLMGWSTVLAYAVTAYFCWRAARRARDAPGMSAGSRAIWILVTLLMVFLCLNKQLDLQSLLTDIGRRLAWKQGWYEDRRELQKWFVVGLLALSCLGCLWTVIRYRLFWKEHFILGIGLASLITFVAIRAVSFHHFDQFLKISIAGLRVNVILELTGIGLILLAAIWDWRYPKRHSKHPRKGDIRSPGP